MYTNSLSLLIVFLLLVNHVTHGQNLSSTIVGCVDVDCPVQDTTAECTVVDKTFGVVGLAQIPVTSSNLTGISWTEGVQIKGSDSRTFEKSFYFGAPPKLNLSGTGACAVFFNHIPKQLAFQGEVETAHGTCQDVMGSGCVNALIQRATSLDVIGLGISDACSKLQSSFQDNLDTACTNIAGSKWTALTVKRK
jgi:hypothetical protein